MPVYNMVEFNDKTLTISFSDNEEYSHIKNLILHYKKNKYNDTNPINKNTVVKLIESDNEIKERTKKLYIKSIHKYIQEDDCEVYLKHNYVDLLDRIVIDYPLANSQNIHISAFIKCYKLLNLTEQQTYFHNKLKENQKKEHQPVENQDIQVAENMMLSIVQKTNELKDKLIEEYDFNRQNYAIGYYFIHHGVPRFDEWRDLYISEGDCDDKENYINLQTKKIVIQRHKTSNKVNRENVTLSDTFIDIIKDYPNKYFITTKNSELYKDGTGISKRIEKVFGFNNMKLRKAKTSINFKNFDMSLCNIQGHSVDTQIKHYAVYK